MDITAQVIVTGSMFMLISLLICGVFYLVIKHLIKSSVPAFIAFILAIAVQALLLRISLQGVVESNQQRLSIVALLFLYTAAALIIAMMLVMLSLMVNFSTKKHEHDICSEQHTLRIMTNEDKPLVCVGIATYGDGTIDVTDVTTRSYEGTSLTVIFDEEVVPAQYQEQPENLPA